MSVTIIRTGDRSIEATVTRRLMTGTRTETWSCFLGSRGATTKVAAGLAAMVEDRMLDAVNAPRVFEALGFRCDEEAVAS